MSRLFDHIMIVDWSAANTPTTGKNSIWISLAQNGHVYETHNAPTRFCAMDFISKNLSLILERKETIFVGFDFAFGYPQSAATQLFNGPKWHNVWAYLASQITDSPHNASNRFEVANKANQKFKPSEGPFWGHPHHFCYEHLHPKKPVDASTHIPEKRTVEQCVKGAKSVWQLAYTGSVGSQTLLGIYHLEQLRHNDQFKSDIAIWPFETRFDSAIDKPIIIGEIYPSMFDVPVKDGMVLDEAQVRHVANLFSNYDMQGTFIDMLGAPDMSQNALDVILSEEGWIVGAKP